jgi:hypothetical protein
MSRDGTFFLDSFRKRYGRLKGEDRRVERGEVRERTVQHTVRT